MTGFDEAGPLAALAAEIPDVYGTVRGYRWWTLAAPPLHEDPSRADETWPPGLLRGMQDAWVPGENTAVCRAGGRHSFAEIPSLDCGCGFWAYWRLQEHRQVQDHGGLPVCGVIEGYGAVMTGTKGFRAARARIIALHLPVKIIPKTYVPPRPDYRADPWGFLAAQGSRVIHHGMPPGYPQAPPAPPPPTEEEIRAAEDRALAWTAVIGDRLAQSYPDARVFESLDAMLAEFPPDPAYLDLKYGCMCLTCVNGLTAHECGDPAFRRA